MQKVFFFRRCKLVIEKFNYFILIYSVRTYSILFIQFVVRHDLFFLIAHIIH